MYKIFCTGQTCIVGRSAVLSHAITWMNLEEAQMRKHHISVTPLLRSVQNRQTEHRKMSCLIAPGLGGAGGNDC